MRRLAVGAGVLVVAAAAAAACGDDDAAPILSADSGTNIGTISDSVCPAAAPDAGETCSLPEGTTCAFGACGSPIARCSAGIWRYAGNPAPQPACPEDFPVEESACPACWPADVSCTYGSTDCTAPDASANTTVASCAEGRWTLRSSPCADAGADVQRDAAPDAD